jgi:uncharacterized protein (DUF1501 family)
MLTNRREFLNFSSAVLATSPAVPLLMRRTAWAAAAAEESTDNVLVVLQLTGGNDGLNTVVPFADPTYRRLRPTLHLVDAELHKLDEHVGLHPALSGLKQLFDEGQAAVIQSVGYPHPNRSHFESMAVWHTAPDDEQLGHSKGDASRGGWLARAIDRRATAEEQAATIQALRIGKGEMPGALLGCRVQIPSLSDVTQLSRRTGLLEEQDVRAQLAAWEAGAERYANPLLQAAARNSLAVHATAEQIERINVAAGKTGDYPDSNLGRNFRLIAQLIRAGFASSMYYTEIDGFDTHSRQLIRHENVLREVGDALRAFIANVNRNIPSRPVLVLVFSEFGRRLAENASQGTDHGTAAPMFLAGSGVAAGVHGPYPDLEHLVDDDPVFGVDFRQVYATVLEKWLGLPSAPILGRRFESLDVLERSAS